jgi:hypothetical protein
MANLFIYFDDTPIKQKQYILLLSRLMCKKNVQTKTIRGKTFINI